MFINKAPGNGTDRTESVYVMSEYKVIDSAESIHTKVVKCKTISRSIDFFNFKERQILKPRKINSTVDAFIFHYKLVIKCIHKYMHLMRLYVDV